MVVQKVLQEGPRLSCAVRALGMVLAEMGSTILGIVSTNLKLREMIIFTSSPSRVLCQGKLLLVLLRLPILLAGAILQITRILPVCVVASRATSKNELEEAVVRLHTMNWVDPEGLDTKAWST